MSQIHPHIRGIYGFLKRQNIEYFFHSKDFMSVLIECGLEGFWKNAVQRAKEHALIMYLDTNGKNANDDGFMSLLNKIYYHNKIDLLVFLDRILNVYINTGNIENFNYDEFKQILVNCGFEDVEIEKMEIWKLEPTIRKKEVSINEEDNFALGTLNHLENSVMHKIYEEIIANPTRYHKESRSITPQRKKAVKIRDDFTCQICNEEFEEDELEVDHILPYGAGGSNEEYNLMALCGECNGNKSAKLDYYRSTEGKLKIMDNIKEFVKTLPIIHDFGDWLEKMGDKRRRK